MRLAYFKSKSSPSLHVAVDAEDSMFCSCPAHYYGKLCRHLLYLITGSDKEVRDLLLRVDELEHRIRQYKSSLEGLNTAFNGALYSSSEMLGLYGMPNVGKTLFMLQDSHYIAAKQGGRVLYLDTEGSAISLYKAWRSVFEARWGKASEIYFAILPDLRELMRFLGYNVDIQLKGSKVEIAASLLPDSELEKVVREKGITLLVFDSLTAPIRNAFPSAPQNFPARADVQSMVFASLAKVASNGVAVAVTHHATVNPANPYDVLEEVRGGLAVKYFTKRLINLTRREKKGMEDIRKFIILRAPKSRERGYIAIARIDGNTGYVDVPYNEEYLTDSELRFVRGHEPARQSKKFADRQQ